MSGSIDPVPDGNRDGYWSGQAAEQLNVYGVAIDADTAELSGLRVKASAIEGRLHEVYTRVDLAERSLLNSTALAPSSGRYAQAQCRGAKLRLLTAIREASDLADALQEAGQEYQRAEDEVRGGFVYTVPRSITGAPEPIPWLFGLDYLPWAVPRFAMIVAGNVEAAADRGQLTPTGPGLGYMLEEMSWMLTGGPVPEWFIPGFENVNRPVLLASALSYTTGLLLGTGTDVTVQRVYPTPQVVNGRLHVRDTYAASGVADTAVGIGDFRERDDLPEGTVRLDRITDADGNVSWQVYVPGTQSSLDDPRPATLPFVNPLLATAAQATPLAPLAPLIRNSPAPPLVPVIPTAPLTPATSLTPAMPALAGPLAHTAVQHLGGAIRNPNPNDWESNLNLFTGQGAASQEGLVQALHAAGVQQGEPVMLAGHSQAGMTVMRVAHDPLVQSQFDIESVITFGGPTGHIPTPDDVAVLHVEHEEDGVHALSNTQNPVAGNRVTVGRTLTDSELAADQGVSHIGDSHDLPAYARTGALIDASNDPAIASWQAQSANVFPSGSVTTESMYFQMQREE
ncbi:hypothetical protein [Ruania halotolerans]|uniref:hypothetical protein n=1 Tax=Ruania halotolerans TaxID=2897773 RepID=UPI001E4C8384|nr:hypothetical protein [Ruania halotolerans]UFU06335.1 hypothetical protein LQF10_18220 [Ruania halotolerans]